MSIIGGGQNNAIGNQVNGYNPFNWSGGGGGVGGKAGEILDPFNITGWNTPDPSSYLGPAPAYPGAAAPYNPLYDPSTMDLTQGVDQMNSQINLNPLDMSVSNFADLADRNGPSAWATAAGQQQNALAENQMEQGATQTNAQTAQALDNLGSSGGITSGARERAAEGGATNYMNMSQNIGRQNTLNQMQIGVNDQQNKMQEMGMLPGMEAQALQPEFQEANAWENANQADVANQIASTNAENAYNQNTYNQQMQSRGAYQQANATAHSGKKG